MTESEIASENFIKANKFFGQGKFDEAKSCYMEVVRLAPFIPEAQNNLAVCLKRLGLLKAAVAGFRRCIALAPERAEFHASLAWLLRDMGRYDEAASALMRAAAIRVDDADLYFSAGLLLKRVDRVEEAAEAFGRAMALRPDLVSAELGHCMAQLKTVYRTPGEIGKSREHYGRALLTLVKGVRLGDSDTASRAAAAVGAFQPYYLAYQEQPDRELQECYGRFICEAMTRRYPQWSERPPVPPREADGRIRVGIVSGFFRWHTIWKLFIRGWAKGLDRRRLVLHGYPTEGSGRAIPEPIRAGFDRFLDYPGDFEAMASAIAADRLHVILYPEIGMDPQTLRLATLRLAPVQCVSWGHPDTTGMPTIDHFLGSDLMEPPGAEQHYSEALVRLPGLGIHYPPLTGTVEAVDLAKHGVAPDDVVYLCCQFVSKYLPQYDGVFARIARAVPRARFVFINPRADRRTGWLMDRLRQAFAAEGLDAGAHVVMLPYLSPAQYQGLNQRADVYLDSIGWSGGNTTLEAVAAGLPIVTLPGALMRGRHTAAILRLADVTETIAADLDGYVDIAAQLGLDAELRRRVGARVAAGAARIHQDLRPLRALEDFLDRVSDNPLGWHYDHEDDSGERHDLV